MNKQDQHISSFVANNEVVIKISDDHEDKLIARDMGLLESAFQSASCYINHTHTDALVQTLKRTPKSSQVST